MRLFLTLCLAALPATLGAQQGAPDGEWPVYGGDAGSTKFSALDQIHERNVDQVSVLWQWRSPDNALAGENPAPSSAAFGADSGLSPAAFKATPIMVDGVLYIRTSLSLVAAIDAASGEQLWVFDPKSYEAGRPTNLGFNSRGVAHWAGGGESRIFLATGDARLWELDAATGEPVADFGSEGSIDLTAGLRREVPGRSYQVMSPPLVVGDVVVIGSSISDGPRYMTAPPGDVRAFDVRTGERRWIFHTVPQAGEPGNDTWENDS